MSFVDSVGLGVLVGAHRRLLGHAHGDGLIQLVCSNGLVVRILRLTGLDRMLPCTPAWLTPLAAMPDRPTTNPASATIKQSPRLPDGRTRWR